MIDAHLDHIAQQSPFGHIHPGTKALLAVGTLILCILSPSPFVPIISGIVLSLVLLLFGKVDPRLYGKILLGPAVFTVVSVIVIIFMLGGDDVLWSTPFLWFSPTITTYSLGEGMQILCRVFGSSVSLFFIVLTTPLSDILSSMRRMGFPAELVDLMMIIYRYIFIVYDQAVEIIQAQIMRLGYSRPREAIHNCAMLFGMLFISSWNAGESLMVAMDARCYNGIFPALEQPESIQIRSLFPVLLYLFFLAVVLVLSAPFTFYDLLCAYL